MTQKMKKILTLIILISFTSFSQQLRYGIGGNIYDSENQKINSETVRKLMKNNDAALAAYNAGRNKKAWGNVLFYGGFGLAAINLYTAVTMDPYSSNSPGSYNSNRTEPTLAIIGGAMVLASIPIKSGYTSKVKMAINEYNNSITNNEKFKPTITLLGSIQGIGVSVQF